MSPDYIRSIKNGDSSVLDEIYVLYRNDFIRWAVKNYQVSIDTATDVFQEVVIAFYQNIVSAKLTALTCDLKTYLFQLGKYQLLNIIKKHKSKVTFFSKEVINVEVENEFMANNHRQTIESQLAGCLGRLCADCEKVIRLFYVHELSMKEVAEQMGYKNADVAKKKRYQCFKKLTEIYSPKVREDVGQRKF